MQQCMIDDPRLLPLYDYMQGRMPLYLHAGDPRHPYSHPARIRKIMDLFPRLVVVAAHMGGWKEWDQVPELLADTGIYLDTSFATGRIEPEEGLRLLAGSGEDRHEDGCHGRNHFLQHISVISLS